MIPISNIYYMLSYAFRILNQNDYKKIQTESFENTEDLMAAILIKAISNQLKRGLAKEYINRTENLSTLLGKIDISQSVKTQSILKKQMVCTYDEFSINCYMNKIIKSTVNLLLKGKISKSRKKELKKLMVYFVDVDTIDLNLVNWKMNYNRNNQTYQMMISICYLISKDLLQTNTSGSNKLMDYTDDQKMSKLYEKFILEYYKKEHPQLKSNASYISRQLDDGIDDMLPLIKSDICLEYGNKYLIIDAKYYSHSTQINFDKHTVHSQNLYQIFTYVKNKDYELKDKDYSVSGLILYAKTDEDIQANNNYIMSGNRISARNIDLNLNFNEIANQLDSIAYEFLYE
ncbi:5-methylcytosine-specific restriction endonuclease system specificity protein McrC [uncultured Anaerococcus sp.]|uniref:5-methylcytosine-specific restriction endonuclease system specificity protein McrC n=1 Tax=uncultured Anaerococcus sp. TaxID=293428 RepID=UPI002616315B|nr:5-methylcytosine-specific restriction endonuclease system specificity protein McrC [uncultured Anaerococcus sp.]